MYLCIWGATYPHWSPQRQAPQSFVLSRGEDRSSLEGRHQGCGVRGAWPRDTPGTGDWTGALAKTSLESCGILCGVRVSTGKMVICHGSFLIPQKLVIFRMNKEWTVLSVMILGWGIPGNRPYEFVWTWYMCPPFQRIMIDNPIRDPQRITVPTFPGVDGTKTWYRKKKGTMFVQEKAELAFRVGFVSAPTSNLV